MPRLLFSEVDIPQSLGPSAFFLLLFAALSPPDLARAQALDPVQSVADMFVDFLAATFMRSIDIISLAVCGFMAMAGRLPRGAALVVTGGIMLVFGAAAIPQIPPLS